MLLFIPSQSLNEEECSPGGIANSDNLLPLSLTQASAYCKIYILDNRPKKIGIRIN